MTDIHQIDDENESAEDFLRKLEKGRTGNRPSKGRGTRPGAPPVAEAPRWAVPPWVAASASLLIWGAGQLLGGRISLGIMFLSFEALVVALYLSFVSTWESWVWLLGLYDVDPGKLQMAFLLAGTLIPIVWFTGVLEAYAGAARHPRARVYSGPSVVPAAASAVVPGWGQILNDQPGKSIAFLTVAGGAGYVIGVALRWPELWSGLDPTAPPIPALGLPAIPVYAAAAFAVAWLIAVIDALLVARRERARD